MKIGFDAKRAYSNSAGLGNFSRNSISALARHYHDDQLFLFNSGKNKSNFITPDNAVEIEPEGFWWQTLKAAWRSYQITKLAQKLELDVYHGLSHELPAGIEKTSIKSVVTIHDLIYIRYPEFYKNVDRAIYDRKFRYACQVARKVHAISEQTKLDLMTYFEVPEEKITVVYQSINPVFYQNVDDVTKLLIRKRHQLPERFILTVGTIEPRKNLMSLLEGMSSEKIYLPLVVVGKFTEYQHKVQKFIEADLSRLQVFFLTKISDEELAALYQMAEVMVYPSMFEGFGLPVAEAQASGCPVITSNRSSLPEAGGNAAIYIDPEKPDEIGQALTSLLADPKLQESLREGGKINARRFTPENFAKQLKQLYNTLLND